jgi:hypothetical protein
MKISKIEQELLEATAVKLPKGNDRQKRLVKIMLAAANLPDEKWEGLTKPAQDWTNDNAEAYKAKEDVADFPDFEGGEPEEEAGEEDQEPAKAKEPPARKKEYAPRKVSACHMVKKIVVKNPTISITDLCDQLKGEGLKVSEVTIATLRSDVRDTLRVLNELDLGSFAL